MNKTVLSVLLALALVAVAAFRIGKQAGINQEIKVSNAAVESYDEAYHLQMDSVSHSNAVKNASLFEIAMDTKQQLLYMEDQMWEAKAQAAILASELYQAQYLNTHKQDSKQ